MSDEETFWWWSTHTRTGRWLFAANIAAAINAIIATARWLA